jgi:putative ABC transport system permease protein
MKKLFHLLAILAKPFGKIFRTDILTSDIVELTSQRFSTKKMRSFLTILGISIGIGAVYFLVSLTFGIQKLVIGKIATSESLLSLDVVPNTETKEIIKLNSAVIQDIAKMENVAEVSAAKTLPVELSFKDIKTQTLAYGVYPSFFRLSALNASDGNLFTNEDKKGIVVSSAILSLFGLESKNAIGSQIRLSFIVANDQVNSDQSASVDSESATPSAQKAYVQMVEVPLQFTIEGIIDDESDYIYIHQDNFDAVKMDEFRMAKVKVASQANIDAVRDKILAKGFLVSAMTDTLQQINQIFQVTQVTFTVIGIVALFIAAIGMLNTMTVSLLERTHEIGIMKAIGATDGGIRQMFLAESVLMGILGGFGGLLVGFIFSQFIGLIINLLAMSLGGDRVNIFFTPPWFIFLVFGFSLFIGLITGYFPARRAAKLNPLDALRYE